MPIPGKLFLKNNFIDLRKIMQITVQGVGDKLKNKDFKGKVKII